MGSEFMFKMVYISNWKEQKFKNLNKMQAIALFQKAYDTLSIIPIGLEKKNGLDFS